MTPDLANLPTDNLYKFVALAGLLILVAANIFPWTLLVKINTRVDDLRTRVAIAQAESDVLGDAISRAEATPNPSPELVAELRARSDAERIKEAELEGHRKSIEHALRQMRQVIWVLVVGSVLGSGLAWVGFGLWYNRLQKYQDRIIAAEAGRLESRNITEHIVR